MTLRVESRGLDELVPRAAGRQCALLQEPLQLLHCGRPGDPRAALGEFECSALGEDVSASLK